MDRLNEQLDDLLRHLHNNTLLQKNVLTVSDLCTYTGLSKSYIYKLTSERTIPHYKPLGKTVFFKKSEIDNWLLTNYVEPIDKLLESALMELNSK